MRKISIPGIHEPLIGPVLGIVLGIALVVVAILSPFVTSVGPGEIVVEDCGGTLTVWRAPKDQGLHWDGLCSTTTYHEATALSFNRIVEVDDARVKLRGRLIVRLSGDDEAIRAMYTHAASEEMLTEEIVPAAMDDVLAAAADPGWHKPQGGFVARELKGAFEYGLRRVSPTGAIWSTHEAKKALESDMRRRLRERAFPYGLTVDAELGFVTER